jgi:hypothetical protein
LPVLSKEAGKIEPWEGPKEVLSPPGLGQIAGPAGVQTGLAVAVMLVLGFVAFTTAPDPALVGALIFIGLAAIAVPLYRRMPNLSVATLGPARPVLPSLPPLRSAAEPPVAPTRPMNSSADADALRATTNAIRERWRKNNKEVDESPKQRAAGFHTVDRDVSDEELEATIHAA